MIACDISINFPSLSDQQIRTDFALPISSFEGINSDTWTGFSHASMLKSIVQN